MDNFIIEKCKDKFSYLVVDLSYCKFYTNVISLIKTYIYDEIILLICTANINYNQIVMTSLSRTILILKYLYMMQFELAASYIFHDDFIVEPAG